MSEKHFIIGIAGTNHGIGVTHLCISFANFTASKCGFKTACLEMNDAETFRCLENGAANPQKRPADSCRRYFTVYGVDYYPSVQKDEIPELFNKGYHYYFLDFGVLNNFVRDEYLRCNKKFLIGSRAPWRADCFQKLFHQYPEIKTMEFFYCMVQFGEKTDIVKLSVMLSFPLRQFRLIPFIKNPFHIKKEQFSFLEELL